MTLVKTLNIYFQLPILRYKKQPAAIAVVDLIKSIKVIIRSRPDRLASKTILKLGLRL